MAAKKAAKKHSKKTAKKATKKRAKKTAKKATKKRAKKAAKKRAKSTRHHERKTLTYDQLLSAAQKRKLFKAAR